MTSVDRVATPAQVMQMAGVSCEDVPLYLAPLKEGELCQVRELASRVVRYVDEVLTRRRCARLWEAAGRQLAVDRGSGQPVGAVLGGDVWCGEEPVWPTDDDHPAPAPTPPPIPPRPAAVGAVPDVETTMVIPAVRDTPEPPPPVDIETRARKPRSAAATLLFTPVTAPEPRTETPPTPPPASVGGGTVRLEPGLWDGQDWSAVVPAESDDPGADPGAAGAPR